MHVTRYSLVVWLLGISACASPEEHFKRQIKDPVLLPYNQEVEKVRVAGDPFKEQAKLIAPEIPAQDDIVLQEDSGRAFVSAMDGWIWKLDLKTNHAERFVQSPLLPAGMVQHPGNPDVLYFCVSRGKGQETSADEPGIYRLTVSTREIKKIGTRVPRMEPRSPTSGQIGNTYPTAQQTRFQISKLDASNSRVVEKADDLAISRDGQRIYFTEPYDHAGATLGASVQSRNEILSLGQNAYLWKYDLKDGTASLVAGQYSYLDGLLLEYSGGDMETSVLVDELSKSRLLRLHLAGPRAGTDEVVLEGLPGLPDGLDRDAQGRVWIALVAERSKLATWLHAHPFWKRLILYLPDRLLPLSKRTGVVVASPDGSTPLYYTMHEGEVFSFVVAMLPGKTGLYPIVYKEGFKGLYLLPYPDALK